MRTRTTMRIMLAVVASALLASPGLGLAATLEPSDGAADDQFGYSVGLSSATGLVGAYSHDTGGATNQGAAYLYQNLDTATGTVNQNAKLIASDGAGGDNFGYSVGLSGTIGLVGAWGRDTNGNGNQGAAYLYRNLDTAASTVNENAKLTASDGAANDQFGFSVGLSGTIGLVGARYHDTGGNDRGAAYLYLDLDTAASTVNENAKLTSSDGAAYDYFGDSVSLSGTTGLVGARMHDTDGNTNRGAAYLYRGLDSATGSVTQDVKLTSSDGAAYDQFGGAVSLSGTSGLVGARWHDIGRNNDQGAAYLYRGLDSASGTVNENVKLIASDGAAGDQFGRSVSLSGTTGLVGAKHDTGGISGQGAAYLYLDLDTASGTKNENVKLWATDGAANDNFGSSVSLDGDQFTIGALGAGDPGKAYSGSVSSMTTLDDGSTQVIDGISFESRNDWVIGDSSSNNQVTLSASDDADVTGTGKAVYVGQNNGSNDNTLVVDGDLNANHVYVGNGSNTGNALAGSGTITGDVTNEGIIAPGNSPGTLSIDGVVDGTGDYLMEIASAVSYDQLAVTGSLTFDGSVIDVNLLGGYAPGIGDTFTLFSAGTLGAAAGYSFDFADAGGAAAWDTSNFLTTGAITSVPEPTTLGLLGLGGLALLRRRKK